MTWEEKVPVLFLFSWFSTYDIFIFCFTGVQTTERLQVYPLKCWYSCRVTAHRADTGAHTHTHNANVRRSLNSQKPNELEEFISSHILKQFQSALFHMFLFVTAKPHANLLHVPSDRRGSHARWQQKTNFTFSFET